MKKIIEAKLNKIIKSVINEIAAPNAPQKNEDSYIIDLLERGGYEYKIKGDTLYVKYSSRNGWTNQSEAYKFFNIVSSITESHEWKLQNMMPGRDGVVFCFKKNKMRPSDMYARPDRM